MRLCFFLFLLVCLCWCIIRIPQGVSSFWLNPGDDRVFDGKQILQVVSWIVSKIFDATKGCPGEGPGAVLIPFGSFGAPF